MKASNRKQASFADRAVPVGKNRWNTRILFPTYISFFKDFNSKGLDWSLLRLPPLPPWRSYRTLWIPMLFIHLRKILFYLDVPWDCLLALPRWRHLYLLSKQTKAIMVVVYLSTLKYLCVGNMQWYFKWNDHDDFDCLTLDRTLSTSRGTRRAIYCASLNRCDRDAGSFPTISAIWQAMFD